MTRAIRSAIRGQRGLKDVGKLSATLSDARDAFGCQPDDTACMRELAKTLGVRILVWGTVERASSQANVTLWATSTSGEQGKLSVKIKSSASSKTYRSIAKKLLMMVVKKRKESLATVNINTIPPRSVHSSQRKERGHQSCHREIARWSIQCRGFCSGLCLTRIYINGWFG